MEIATKLKRGMIIKHNGMLHLVVLCSHNKTGRGSGSIVSKLKNLESGVNAEYRWRSDEKFEEVELDEIPMEYLYQDGDQFWFMNNATFDQIAVNREVLEEELPYLIPNAQVRLIMYEGNPIEVRLPNEVTLVISETGPNARGNTAGAATKPATCETGLVVQVPLFIETGEKIIVATEDGVYVGRAKEK